MLTTFALFVLLQRPPPKLGKPDITVFAQQLLDRALGPELLLDHEKPTLTLSAAEPTAWLAVEVWASTGPAGAPRPGRVVLTVKQGKVKQVHALQQRGDGDTEVTPFFVRLDGCEPVVLTAAIGARTHSRTLTLTCD